MPLTLFNADTRAGKVADPLKAIRRRVARPFKAGAVKPFRALFRY